MPLTPAEEPQTPDVSEPVADLSEPKAEPTKEAGPEPVADEDAGTVVEEAPEEVDPPEPLAELPPTVLPSACAHSKNTNCCVPGTLYRHWEAFTSSGSRLGDIRIAVSPDGKL